MKYGNIDVELTKEQEDALKDLLPICKEREFDYTPKDMRALPEAVRPVFRLQTLTAADKLDLQSAAKASTNDESGVPLARGDYARGVIERGLLGWRQFYSQDGAEIVYDKAHAVDLLGSSTTLLLDLVSTILMAGRLSREERLGLTL